jgi:hypothetical protein
MALRSRYREKLAEAPNIPEIKVDDQRVEPSEKLSIEEPSAAIDTVPPADEATVALMRQLESLRKSEELQKQYAMHQHAVQMAQRTQPQTRVQYLQSQGLTKAEAEFFDSREDMMSNQQLASEAASEALAAGIERDSPQFFEAVEQGFAKRVEALNQRAAEPAPAPAFFEPTEPTRSPAAPDRSSLYAAPVSRGAPSGETGYRPARQIKLTPQDQEYARIAGISDVEYAKQKQRLALHKANGDYTGRE